MKVLLSSQESVKQESLSISPSDWVDERQTGLFCVTCGAIALGCPAEDPVR
ncbi:MAG: hypothetical protein HC857_12165 [Synechococcales cyanobacterium RU_4_20]|nr:hypothetical protein [Synechococcales cyanobacterium RU_4_20]